jgi:hypothetical protein
MWKMLQSAQGTTQGHGRMWTLHQYVEARCLRYRLQAAQIVTQRRMQDACTAAARAQKATFGTAKTDLLLALPKHEPGLAV